MLQSILVTIGKPYNIFSCNDARIHKMTYLLRFQKTDIGYKLVKRWQEARIRSKSLVGITDSNL